VQQVFQKGDAIETLRAVYSWRHSGLLERRRVVFLEQILHRASALWVNIERGRLLFGFTMWRGLCHVLQKWSRSDRMIGRMSRRFRQDHLEVTVAAWRTHWREGNNVLNMSIYGNNVLNMSIYGNNGVLTGEKLAIQG